MADDTLKPASPPGRAVMPPRDRFGYNDPPNAHISRDTPIVLREAEPATEPSKSAGGLGSTPPHFVELTAEQPLGKRGTNAATTSILSAAGVPMSTSSRARSSARAELTRTPKPVTIVPTPYPDDPAAPLVLSNYIRIDLRSAEFREFNAKLDLIIGHLDRSNLFSGDTQQQLTIELQMGRMELTAPRPDRNLIHLLLTHGLKFIAVAAAGAIIGQYATEALQLLEKIITPNNIPF
jgi:hypothetical protein